MAAINTVFRLVNNVSGELNKINQGFKDTSKFILIANQAMSLFTQTTALIKNAVSAVDDLTNSYFKQTEQETKLYTVMRERMTVSKQDVDSVKELSKELQNVGIYNDQIMLAAAQEAATFVTQRESIETMLPALANLVAQQYGYSASAENARSAATRMGKVLLGNVDGLSKLGYVFTDAEKKILKTGTEMERVATLTNIINANVGNMNEALAKTPQGRIVNLKNSITDLREEIGKNLVAFQELRYRIQYAFMTKAYEALLKGLDWVRKHAEDVKAALSAIGVTAAIVAGIMAASWIVANSKLFIMIAVIGMIVKALRTVGVTTTELVSIIAGVFGSLYVIFYDIFAFVYDLIASIVNSVVGAINLIIKGINGVKGLLGQGEDKMVKTIEWKMEGMEFKGADTVNDFMDKGAKFTEAIGKGVDFIANYDISSNIDVEKTSGGALLVHDESLIDIASDYRELLSKRATQAFNLQYARPFAPSVTIERVDIRKEVDADNVLNRFTSALIDLGSSSLSVAN